MIPQILTPEQQAWVHDVAEAMYDGCTDSYMYVLNLHMDRFDIGHDVAHWICEARLAQLAIRLSPDELKRGHTPDEVLVLVDQHFDIPDPDAIATLNHVSALQQALAHLVQHTEALHLAVEAFQELWDEEFVVLSEEFDNHLHHLSKLCTAGLYTPARAHLNERQ
jgi:hypothetical protein